MVSRNTFPNDGAGQSVLDTRMTTAGLVIRDAAGNPRVGVLYDSDERLVSPTSGMSYLVRDHRAVTSRSGKGVELHANDGALSVPTIAAPPSNSRVEIVYERARFAANADGSSLPEIGVVRGSAAVTPVNPALPAGALPLARFVIPSGATSTQSAGVVGQDVAPFTCGVGGTVVVRSVAELNAWAPADGAEAHCLADTFSYFRRGGKWLRQEVRTVTTTLANASAAASGWVYQDFAPILFVTPFAAVPELLTNVVTEWGAVQTEQVYEVTATGFKIRAMRLATQPTTSQVTYRALGRIS